MNADDFINKINEATDFDKRIKSPPSIICIQPKVEIVSVVQECYENRSDRLINNEGRCSKLMRDNRYVLILRPEEFHWLWEDIELSLHSAQKRCFLKDESGKFHDLTDYRLVDFLRDIRKAFQKANKEHICIDEVNQQSF